jgi:NAD(P)-dependent dehydrogenase (short-subunit alcohol dehydrogenase family)
MHIVITGANRGIGQALADRYRAQGHDVTGTARDSSAQLVLDVTDPKQQAAMAQGLAGRPVDLLICNAGVYLDKGHGIDGYPADMWAQSFATNVTGVFLTVQALLPNLRAAKGKVAILSSQMASHTRADGVAVGIYHPGWVQTDMGGTQAEITVDQAADGLLDRFGALSLATTGCFETWDGQPHDY